MSLIPCKECGEQISSTAKTCPKCGAKVPHLKWWLWVPVGLVVAFLAFGFAVKPKTAEEAYQHQYNSCLAENAGRLLVNDVSKFDYCRYEAEEAKRRFR